MKKILQEPSNVYMLKKKIFFYFHPTKKSILKALEGTHAFLKKIENSN